MKDVPDERMIHPHVALRQTLGCRRLHCHLAQLLTFRYFVIVKLYIIYSSSVQMAPLDS